MVERKVFDFYKRIPGVGFIYGAVRGIVYAAADNEEEAKYSWEMDLADFNPLRMTRNFANGIRNIVNDLDEGSDSDEYRRYCSRFSWTKIPETVRTSTSTLKDYARSFEGTNYHLLFIDGNNCQTFVAHMLAKAADISVTKAQGVISLIMPNLLF